MAASGACRQITTAWAVPDVRATNKVLEENTDYAGKADQIMVAFPLLVQFLLWNIGDPHDLTSTIWSLKANRPVARRSCSKKLWDEHEVSSHMKNEKGMTFTTKQFLILSHIMAVQILCCARAGDGKYLACFRRATKPTKHATQLPAFGSKPMKKFVSYQWKPCKVKMFSYSATKKWIKTYNLRSLREKKRYQKQQKTHLHEKLLKKQLLNLIELSIIIT